MPLHPASAHAQPAVAPALGTEDSPQALRQALAQSQQQLHDMAAAQEEFLRAVSHDLRAPLRHVTSYGALVRELLEELRAGQPQPQPALEEALEFVGTMEQSSRRMALMIDGLQTLSRASRAPLVLAPVLLDPSLALAVQSAVQAAAAHSAQGQAVMAEVVEWDIPAGLPALRADEALLQQLLQQLLGNALKFSRARHPARIAVQVLPAAPGRVRWCVQDNGVGFDGTRAAQLMGVFQRMHRETEFPGVGVGLALCRQIAQRHGAHLEVQATLGEGCRITLDWPAA
jgi:signal transduction histidine kinase